MRQREGRWRQKSGKEQKKGERGGEVKAIGTEKRALWSKGMVKFIPQRLWLP